MTGKHSPVAVDRVLATVLFTDIAGSTERAAALGDDRWRRVLDDHDATAKTEIDRHSGRLIKLTGDGMLATFDGPGRAIACARSIMDSLTTIEITLRVGIHTGEVEVRDGDVGGIAVHIASRIQNMAEPNEILVSRTVVDLAAGSGLKFAEHGTHELRGVPGNWQLFTVVA